MPEFLIPLHPKMVHFPVALFMVALFFELLSLLFKKEAFHKIAVSIYVFAALVTPLVVYTGLWEADRLRLHHPVLTQHKTFALWTMWTALASLPLLWFLRKKSVRSSGVFFLFLLIGLAVFVTITSYYGGEMVYEYGVGVNH